MENEKLLNNILLIVILLLAANYLSGGSIIEVFKKYLQKIKDYINNNFSESFESFTNSRNMPPTLMQGLKTCSRTTPPIVHDQDFKHIFQKNKNLHKDDPNMKKLYHFLQSLITFNNHYEMIQSQNKPQVMSQNDKDSLTKFINKSFNCGDFKFTNLVILDSIIYFENGRGKELKPFRISGDVYVNKVPIGKITLHLEMFIRLDSTFYGPFNSGFPTFTRIKLLKKDKIATPLTEIEHMTNTKDNQEYTENSLIPDSINFSTENTDNSDDSTSNSSD